MVPLGKASKYDFNKGDIQTKIEIDEVLQKINLKAQTDKQFRKLCLTNPREAINHISGRNTPEGFVVQFIENKGAHYTHLLPDFIDELYELELNYFAGGIRGIKECARCGGTEETIWENGFCTNCLK